MCNIDYDKSKWICVPENYADCRFVLGTRGEKPLIVIGINPSTAVPGNLDSTMKSVERIVSFNGFDSYIMINVYAERATNPDNLEAKVNNKLHAKNLEMIENMLKSISGEKKVWAAWGTNIEKRKYLKLCLEDLKTLLDKYNASWYKAGKVSKAGHPHHPLYLKGDSILEPFNIEEYIEQI